MIRTYTRPPVLEEALALLADREAAVLAGGTALNGDAVGAPTIVVDLQDLGLDGIVAEGTTVRIGAMATLQSVADADAVPALIRESAHREAPNTIRNAATAGGVIGSSDPESELLAGFLVYDARIVLAREGGATEVELVDLLDEPERLGGSIITEIVLPVAGRTAVERTARTPMDRPIVMVAGRLTDDGTLRLVAAGVAATPTYIDVDALDELDPPGDFRGSPAYRRHLAAVLSARVVDALRGGAS